MQAIIEETAVVQKTRELCETLLSQPDVQDIRRRIDAFMADDRAKSQYEAVMTKSQSLHQKQHQGETLTDAEIADFEKERDTLVNNPVARGFLDAQKAMHEVQESVTQYVSKTLELGRVPEATDFDDGSCGHGCGCHH